MIKVLSESLNFRFYFVTVRKSTFFKIETVSFFTKLKRLSALLSKDIDELASTAFDFLTTDGELKHNTTVLAVVFLNLWRRHFIDAVASCALNLLWTGDEL